MMSNNDTSECTGLICRIWQFIKSPSVRYSLGALLAVGFIAGIIFWGGFNTAMEMTNNEEFCISCHEMEENVYQEYKDTIHYSNRTGVRATCPDCHVPKEWTHKVVRKIKATNELFHKAMGSIGTPEKFEAKRLQLARNVWRAMKTTDSRECRNCHNFDSMDFGVQGRRAVNMHSKGLEEGKTCIDCHKGIAHRLPDMRDEDPTAVVGNN
jgi:cytochrome c-type protein NapC